MVRKITIKVDEGTHRRLYTAKRLYVETVKQDLDFNQIIFDSVSEKIKQLRAEHSNGADSQLMKKMPDRRNL